jgi:photosystem II stability/assembly factor-like uncharacterized protein
MNLRTRIVTYRLLGVLTLSTGLGIGLGLSEAPTQLSAHPLVLATQTPTPGTQSPSPTTISSVLTDLGFLPEPSFQFISPKLGWLEPPDQDRILLTVDGGRTWRTTYIAPTTMDQALITNVQFVNHHDGWALVNRAEIIDTHNGGRSWSNLRRLALLSFDFVSSRDGWALTSDGGLLSTVDGGRTWTVVSSPLAASLCTTRTGEVWLGGVDGDVYVSNLGGSWQPSLLSSSVPDIHNSVVPNPAIPAPSLFCTATSVWALYSYGEAAGSMPYALERTLDGGANWTAVLSAEVLPAIAGTPRGAGGSLVDLAVEGSSNAQLLAWCSPCETGDPTITSTTDGTGFTAKLLPLPPKTYGWPSSMAFLNAKEGWVVMREMNPQAPGVSSGPAHSAEVVLRTRDGGRRWQIVDRWLRA